MTPRPIPTSRLAVLYGLLALLSFPTLETILGGTRGIGYNLDVFDLAGGVARIAATVNQWGRSGLTWWDPFFGAGNDILAQHSLAPIAPDVALGFVLGPFLAYVVTAWLMVAVAGLAMHLFLRDVLRLPAAACLVGSILYLFSFWHYIYGFAGPALPLGLWLADRAVRASEGRWRALVGWIALNGFLLYAGLSQVVLIGGLVQLGWLLVATPDGPRVLVRVGWWVAAWAGGVALNAPVLLTQLRNLPTSERSAWILSDIFDSRPLHAIGDALSFYSGVLFGLPVAPGIGGSADRYGTYFPGVVGLVLVVVAIVMAVRRPLDRRTVAIVGLLAIIPLVDVVSVLFTPVQQELGFLRSFQLVRIRHVLPFALAAAAAIGAAQVLDAERREDLRERLRAMAGKPVGRLVVAAAGLGLVAVVAWPAVVGAGRLWRAIRRPAGLGTADLGWTLALLAVAIGVVAVVLVGRAIVRRRLGTVAAVSILLLVGADRMLFAHGERLSSGALGTYEQALATTPGQAFILGQGAPELNRVLTFGDAGDRMGAVGLYQADGYQAIYPLGFHDLFGTLTAPTLDHDPDLHRYFWSWGVRAYTFGPAIDPEIADLLAVRWFYVRGEQPPTAPGVERFHGGDVTVYENPDALPRAFVATSVATAGGRFDLVDALGRASRSELASTVWVPLDERAGLASIPDAAGAPAAGAGGAGSRAAVIDRYSPDAVDLSVPDGPAGVLVLTDNAAPGWIATVDGSPAAIRTVDLAFRGIELPAGPHAVSFRYAPTATYLGFAIAAVGALGTLLLGLVVRRRDRAARDRAGARTGAPTA